MEGDISGWTYRPNQQMTDSSRTQATVELAATYAALILADDGIEITVSTLSRPAAKIHPS